MPSRYQPLFQEPEEKPADNTAVKEAAGTVARTGAGLAVPLAIRLGTGIGSGIVSNVPGVGSLLGGGISGAGEILAQLIETGGGDVNWPRVGVESAIGAVPMGKLFKAGKMAAGAAYGGTLAGAGVIGRKATDDDPETSALNPKDYSAWDAAQVALGAGMGAGAAKWPTKAKVDPADANRYQELVRKGPGNISPAEQAEFDALTAKGIGIDGKSGKPGIIPAAKPATKTLKAVEKMDAEGAPITPAKTLADKLKQWRPDDKALAAQKGYADEIDQTAARMEALDGPLTTAGPTTMKEAAHGLRVAAAESGTGNAKIYNDITKSREQGIIQNARNLNAAGKFIEKDQAQTAKNLNTAAKFTEKGWQQEAKNANAVEKYNAGIKKETDKAALKAEKARMDAWQQEARNENLADEARRAQANAAAVQARIDELMSEGATASTIVTQTSKTEGPDSTLKATTVLKAQPTEDGGGATPRGGKTPKAPKAPAVAAKPGVYQLVSPDGKVVSESTDPDEMMDLINAAGPTYRVVPPADAAPTGTPAAAKVPETPAVTPKTEEPLPVTTIPEAPPVTPTPEAPPATPAKPPKAKKIKGTPAEATAKLEKALAQPPATPVSASTTPVVPIVGKPVDEDLLARLRVSNPVGQQSYTPGISKPEGVILEPGRNAEGVAREGSGWLRTKFGPKVSDFADTVKPVDQHAYQGDGIPPTRPAPLGQDEIAQITADLDNIQDPLIREMALRELGGGAPTPPQVPPTGGKVRGPRVSQTPPVDELKTQAEMLSRPSGRAPQELLDQAAALNRRRDDLQNNPAIPDEQRAAMAAEIEKEANELQLKILIAERAAEKGEAGFITPDILLQNVVPGAAGALFGAALDDEDPLRGAMIGGTAGAVGPSAINALRNMNTDSLRESAEGLGRTLPNMQRGLLLADEAGLAINSALAPWGAGMMGSGEKILQGILEGVLPHQTRTGAMQEGVGGVKQLFNVTHPLRIPEAFKTARNTLEGVNERGEMLMHEAPTVIDRLFAIPSTIMATGDMLTRSALRDAGWTEDAARAATLTANPKTGWGRWLAEAGKENPIVGMLQPFRRTGVNIVESGLERAPVFGLFYNTFRDPTQQQELAAVLSQQGIGAAVAYAAYQFGANVDPDTAKQWQLAKIISNMSGQYGAIAASAYAAGMANQMGRDPGPAAITEGMRNLPLPATQLLEDYFKSALQYSKGEPAHPNAEYWPQRWLPRGLMPTSLSDRNIEAKKELSRYVPFD